MNRLTIAVAAVALSLSPAAFAQAAPAPPPVGPAAEAISAYNRGKPNILKSADKMPADAYTYKPVADVRTYARVLNHVTEAQLHVCGALNGMPFDPKVVPADTADKATIITALKSSFDACDKAYAALTDSNLNETFLALGPVKRSRITLAWGNVAHNAEQYATLALYLRLKGIVPPSSEK